MGLPPTVGGGAPDVRVLFGDVEHPSPADLPPGEGCWRASSDEARYFWSDVGAFGVYGGTRIVLDPAPGLDEDGLRLTVLGPLLATILHQRGYLVLHASAVAGADGAVAVAAHSGTGKSTTAGALVSRGYSLLTDDVLAVDLAGAVPVIWPGGSNLKLWPASAEALGHDAEALPTIGTRYVKRVLDVEPATKPVPLRGLYVLAAEAGPTVEAMGRPQAVGEVMSRSYCSELLRLEGAGRNLKEAADLVQRVPVRWLRRSATLDSFGSWVDRVVADMADLAGGSPPAHIPATRTWGG